MFALHHPRGVLCAKASHKVNFEEYPPSAELCRRNLTTLRHALKRDGVQMQELGSLFDVKHAIRASIASRDRAAARNAGRLMLGVSCRLAHVITSVLSKICGRKSA